MSNWREHLFIFCLVTFLLSLSTLIFAASYRLFQPSCPCSCCPCEVTK